MEPEKVIHNLPPHQFASLISGLAVKKASIPGTLFCIDALLIWLPVMAYVALGREQSIANMFFNPPALLAGAEVNIPPILLKNLLPATPGNIAGGMLWVAVAYLLLWGKNEKMESQVKQQAPSQTKASGAPGSNRLAIEQDLSKILNSYKHGVTINVR